MSVRRARSRDRSGAGWLLFLFFTFLQHVLSTPTIGIQRDWGGEIPLGNDDGPHSYSAVIEFDDASVPGDSSKMSDAQLTNLVSLAYQEMLQIWSQSQLRPEYCPGGMAAMESEGRIYFASSVRAGSKARYKPVDQEVRGSIGWFQEACMLRGLGHHRAYGGCAEPNMLRLYGDIHGTVGSNPARYQSPPANDKSPRMAAWIMDKRKGDTGSPKNNPASASLPCKDNDKGYGCETLVEQYKLKPVEAVAPDPNGEDDWKFKWITNPRHVCPDTKKTKLLRA